MSVPIVDNMRIKIFGSPARLCRRLCKKNNIHYRNRKLVNLTAERNILKQEIQPISGQKLFLITIAMNNVFFTQSVLKMQEMKTIDRRICI